MTIGTPAVVWPLLSPTGQIANNATSTIKTTVLAPAGSLVCFFLVPWDGGSTISSFSDGTANVYTIVNSPTQATTNTTTIAYTFAKVPIPVGASITAAETPGTGGYYLYGGFKVSGITNPPIDTNHSSNTGVAGTSITIATGVLAATAEIVIANLKPGGATGAVTEGTSFTSYDKPDTSADISYRIVNSTATVSWNPSWVNSVAPSAVLLSFKGAIAPPRKNIIRITKRTF